MTPIDFPECNLTLRGDSPDVNPLPVLRADGWLISCWRLTPEERRMVALTGVLWIGIQGQTHPPILPSIEEPFTGISAAASAVELAG